MSEPFLQLQARTQHFTLGQPRNITLDKTGSKIFFIRAKSPTDARGCVWRKEIGEHTEETLLVDPMLLMQEDNIPFAEKARRERARETAGGIVAFSVTDDGSVIAFSLGSDVYMRRANDHAPVCIAENANAFDIRINPSGTHVAYIADGSLVCAEVSSPYKTKVLAAKEEDITWGQADFIAAEEMDRLRGYWWAPDGQHIIAESVDTSVVQEWYITDPADPSAKPASIKYPAAGTTNALVGLTIFSLDGKRIPINWDKSTFEYLVSVQWTQSQPYIAVQSRDQKRLQVLSVDPGTGATTLIREFNDPSWIEIVAGAPQILSDGALLYVGDAPLKRQLFIDDEPISSSDLYVRHVVGVLDDGGVVFTANQGDPTCWHIWIGRAGKEPIQITSTVGIYSAVAKGNTVVIRSNTLKETSSETTIYTVTSSDVQMRGVLKSNATPVPLHVRPVFYHGKKRATATAVLLPEDYKEDSPLPIIVDSYGGPHAQRVVATARAYIDAQWLANQGFAVVITDGRGTPGRNPGWEKAIQGDVIGPILEDQITALQEVAVQDDRLDLSRVGIKGWSFGGYLAAYAVVRRPDIFHAAIAGAPVTDWRLYDTHYSERYLGDPHQSAAAYDACSLLKEATSLQQPLLLVHGLADDNVVVAHTLQFSRALLAAGRPHQVLPLSGITHMASQATVAENLEKLQLDFFQQHLVQRKPLRHN